MNKKGGMNWSEFFILIGFIFQGLLVVALIVGNSAGKSSWGYIISHSILAWIIIGILFLNAIRIIVIETRKEKLLKNQDEKEEDKNEWR